ncbi:MAG: type II toxin-antitoxin system prevent-host-death family antitoxin [Candidatus Lokiarchaeota archaeon]|nr:type II toxin-antitoxin system prevent-host-death family antitoxin [Candidatus Lokiarchaeota archaeon]
MHRIKLAEDIQPLSEFRANVASFIEKVRKTKRPLVITQHGKSAAVMMDVEEYEKLIEKLELLTDIHIAESQLENGKGISHQQAKDQILGTIKK